MQIAYKIILNVKRICVKIEDEYQEIITMIYVDQCIIFSRPLWCLEVSQFTEKSPLNAKNVKTSKSAIQSSVR